MRFTVDAGVFGNSANAIMTGQRENHGFSVSLRECLEEACYKSGSCIVVLNIVHTFVKHEPKLLRVCKQEFFCT